jgi:hypothetical protein
MVNSIRRVPSQPRNLPPGRFSNNGSAKGGLGKLLGPLEARVTRDDLALHAGRLSTRPDMPRWEEALADQGLVEDAEHGVRQDRLSQNAYS